MGPGQAAAVLNCSEPVWIIPPAEPPPPPGQGSPSGSAIALQPRPESPDFLAIHTPVKTDDDELVKLLVEGVPHDMRRQVIFF